MKVPVEKRAHKNKIADESKHTDTFPEDLNKNKT